MTDGRLGHVEPLTERESEILELLAADLTDLEIANRLVIGRTTVRFHNRNIYGKLGVADRGAAVRYAREHGLLTTAELGAVSVENNLPAQTTPFIGRGQELAEISDLLVKKDVRLVTLLAPGGMGKSRLALRVAEGFVSNSQLSAEQLFPDGVYFVPLAPLNEVGNILFAIASQVDYQFGQDDRDAKQQLLDYFGDKQLLLLVDNFEHLLEGAGVVSDILAAAPGVRVLATSRGGKATAALRFDS